MADTEKMPIQEVPAAGPESARENPEKAGGFEAPKAPEASVTTESAVSATAVIDAAPAAASPQSPEKDEMTKGVESVLEEGLAETYKAMDLGSQNKFRDEGERVTGEIVGMMKKAKVKARKVLDLIRGWLKIIPRVNPYFLDQEAKIKTDKVMHLSDREGDQELL